MMAKEDQNNKKTQAETVASSPAATAGESFPASGYKHGGIGLAIGIGGGIVGALIVMLITQFVQKDNIPAQITSQAERIEELKSEREQEFSRVFNALAELENKGQNYQSSLDNMGESLVQVQSAAQTATEATAGLAEETGAQMATLSDRLTQLETQSTETTIPADQTNWGAEIAALKTQIIQWEEKITALPQVTQQLKEEKQARLSLEAAFEKASKRIMDALIQQDQEIRDLQDNLASLQNNLASLSSAPPPASDQSMAMLIAANSLKAAVDRGGSYQGEWQIFAPLAPSGLRLDVLESYSASGLPNIAELSRRFARLADEIAASENTLAPDAGLTDQLLHQGSQLYSSRPIGEVEGDGAAAIAARMEVAIAAGDFSRALSEAQALPQEAQVIADDFIKILQARQTVDALLSQLIATALQEKDRFE